MVQKLPVSLPLLMNQHFLGLIQNNYQALLKGPLENNSPNFDLLCFGYSNRCDFGLFSVAPIRALRTIASIYVDIIRGIPMMVLAFLYFLWIAWYRWILRFLTSLLVLLSP